MPQFRELVEQEKHDAHQKNGSFNSMHEIYGVLAEEVFKFFQQVLLRPAERNPQDILDELVQIASVAEMAAEDMQLVDVSEAVGENIYKTKYEEFVRKVRNLIENTVVNNVAGRLQKYKPLVSDAESNLIHLTTSTVAYNELLESEECQPISP